MTQINKTHTAIANIGIDTYTVTTTTANNQGSNQGGNAVVATENAQMDGCQTLLPTITLPEYKDNFFIKNYKWYITKWYRNII